MSATSPAPRQRRKAPTYRKHKASGQAFVQIKKRRFYLGKHGTEASWEKYQQTLQEKWINPPPPPPPQYGVDADDVDRLTVIDLLFAYMKHAQEHYRKHGQATGTIANIKPALRRLRESYGETLAREFGPLKLKALRETWIDGDLSIKTVNEYAAAVKRVFYWANENELVPSSVDHGLRSVRGLQAGRTRARETKPIPPVQDDVVEATLPYLPAVVADMVQFQRWTAARPGEVCALQPGQVKRRSERSTKRERPMPLFPGEPAQPAVATGPEDDVWEYRPGSHKTEHHGRSRVILIGPRAQAILRPYLVRGEDDYCFSPAESERKRRRDAEPAAGRKHRRTVPLALELRRRPPRSRYTAASYRKAVQRACERAFEMPLRLRKISRKLPAEERAALHKEAAAWRAEHVWNPNQLRHTAATEMRAQFGLEASQIVLGHKNANTTEIYAERDLAKAKAAVKEVG